MNTGLKRYRQTRIEDAEYPHLKEDASGIWCLFDDAEKRIAELDKAIEELEGK